MDRALCGLSIGLATFVLGASASAQRQSCVLETLDDPDGNLAQGGTTIYGITNSGLATGNFVDDAGTSHGLLYLRGQFQAVDYPQQGPLGTYFYYANQAGLVAGNYWDADGLSHSIVYDTRHGTWEALPDGPGTAYNAAGGVDARGRVSGNYGPDPNGNTFLVAWVYDGTYDTFIAPASDQALLGTATYGMNGKGTVVGWYLDSSNVRHGFTRAIGEEAQAFDVPGATSTRTFGINTSGALSGDYHIGDERHGYVYQRGRGNKPGSVTNFDYPGALATIVAGINDAGDIVGYYFDQDSFIHGFIGPKCLAGPM